METTVPQLSQAIDTTWVMVAAILVMFMQAGFLFLEIGFSRMKNAGTIVPKVLANFSIAALCYWAVGFALAFGGSGWFAGTHGFFLDTSNGDLFPAMSFSDAVVPAKFFFQFVFCAVSLAIVWGTTLERIKFGAYLIYAIVFSSLIYPIISHWIFGGGWLQVNFGMQDFAGSTVVHLIGATGALAALLLFGARQGKYGPDGKPNVIPGHSMPIVGLGVLILWFGWFGFNPGSTLVAIGGRFAEVAVVTNLAAAAGVLGAMTTIYADHTHLRHRHDRERRDRRPGRDHGPVRIRRVLGRPDHRLRGGHHRGGRRDRDRPRARRPGGRALGPRPGRRLGHALVRHLHRRLGSRRRMPSVPRASGTTAPSTS